MSVLSRAVPITFNVKKVKDKIVIRTGITNIRNNHEGTNKRTSTMSSLLLI